MIAEDLYPPDLWRDRSDAELIQHVVACLARTIDVVTGEGNPYLTQWLKHEPASALSAAHELRRRHG